MCKWMTGCSLSGELRPNRKHSQFPWPYNNLHWKLGAFLWLKIDTRKSSSTQKRRCTSGNQRGRCTWWFFKHRWILLHDNARPYTSKVCGILGGQLANWRNATTLIVLIWPNTISGCFRLSRNRCVVVSSVWTTEWWMQSTLSWMTFQNPNSRRPSTRNRSNGWTAVFRQMVDTLKKSLGLIRTSINVTTHFFVLVLLFFLFFFFRKITGVRQTHVTKRGVTSQNFNISTSFYALSTGHELPYTQVFLFGRETALYVHPKRGDSSFISS